MERKRSGQAEIKRGPLLRIVWRDAFSPTSPSWANTEAVEEFVEDHDYIVETVGWKVHENAEMLTIAGSIAASGPQFIHLFRIPKGTIIARQRLVAEAAVRIRRRAKVRR